jgi:hypothetical protein
MAWEKNHSVKVSGLTRGQIWRVWKDVNQWHCWDLDIEFARIEGPFEAGNSFQLKPKNGPKVRIKLLKVQPETAFTDVTCFPLAKMFGIHEMQEVGDQLEIRHTVRIEGPLSFLWKKIVAEKVAAGLDEQAQKMIERARRES